MLFVRKVFTLYLYGMAKLPTPHWYLNVNGVKTGPYTRDQILGLLEDGEIRADSKVTSHKVHHQWITIEQFIAMKKRPAAPASGNFEPPPRPPEVEQERTLTQAIQRDDDPTITLFTALQVSKERKTHSRDGTLQAEVHSDWAAASQDSRRVPPQLLMVLTIGAVLSGAVWGTWHILKNLAEPDSAESRSVGATDEGPSATARSMTRTPITPRPAAAAPFSRPAPPVSRAAASPVRTAPPRAIVNPIRPVEDRRDDRERLEREKRERTERDREARERELQAREEREYDQSEDVDEGGGPIDRWESRNNPRRNHSYNDGSRPARGGDPQDPAQQDDYYEESYDESPQSPYNGPID